MNLRKLNSTSIQAALAGAPAQYLTRNTSNRKYFIMTGKKNWVTLAWWLLKTWASLFQITRARLGAPINPHSKPWLLTPETTNGQRLLTLDHIWTTCQIISPEVYRWLSTGSFRIPWTSPLSILFPITPTRGCLQDSGSGICCTCYSLGWWS